MQLNFIIKTGSYIMVNLCKQEQLVYELVISVEFEHFLLAPLSVGSW